MAEKPAAARAIEVSGAVKRYGDKTVVRDVDLYVRSGEHMVLIGHNGAGKTTLLKLMLGLTRPSAGQVSVLGSDPATVAAAQRHAIGYLPESVAFHSAMKGREVLAFYARLYRLPRSRVESVLTEVGLLDHAQVPAGRLSPGLSRRLAYGRATLHEPETLVLQDPFGRCDSASVGLLRARVRKQAESGRWHHTPKMRSSVV